MATAGAVSAALILSERGIRAMYLTKLIRTVMFLLIAGGVIGSASLIAVRRCHPGLTAARAEQPRGRGAGAEDRYCAAPAQGDPSHAARPSSVTLDGRVLDPDGRPIEGASLHVWYLVTAEPRFAEIQGASGPGPL